MQQILVNARVLLPAYVKALLPEALVGELEAVVPQGQTVEELRLRCGRAASVTVAGENLRLEAVLSAREMQALLLRMCEGSLYAHAETLKEGYLVLPEGVRVGVCGRAAVVGGSITGIDELSSFSIRIPHQTPQVGGEIAALLRRLSFSRGVLLYAPPGVGKTTVLRGVGRILSGGACPLRVAVIDTRGEFAGFFDEPSLLVDMLSGYPRGRGISIATRTLSAQLILCDEIGDMSEAQEIVSAHIGGVPLVASAHAASLGELLARPGLRLLHEARCFGAYVRLSREAGEYRYGYDVADWEAADALF